MSPLLVLGLIAVVYYVLESQQKALIASISRTQQSGASSSPSPSISDVFGSLAASPGHVEQDNTTDAQITKGFQTALQYDPDPTGISQSILAIGGKISGIFTAHHAAAVKAEAQTLNDAVPRWRNLLGVTTSYYSKGQISAKEATSYIDQAVGIYYDNVKGIIKGRPPAGGCGANYSQGPITSPAGEGCPKPPIDPCNGPCSIAWYTVEPEAYLAKQMIASTESTGKPYVLRCHVMPPHAGFNGYQAQSFPIQRRG